MSTMQNVELTAIDDYVQEFSPQVDPKPRSWPPLQGIALVEVRHELLMYGEVLAIVFLLVGLVNVALYPWVRFGHVNVLHNYENVLNFDVDKFDEVYGNLTELISFPTEGVSPAEMLESVTYKSPGCAVSTDLPPNQTAEHKVKCETATHLRNGFMYFAKQASYDQYKELVAAKSFQKFHKYECCHHNRLKLCPCGFVVENATHCFGPAPLEETCDDFANGTHFVSMVESDPMCKEFVEMFENKGYPETKVESGLDYCAVLVRSSYGNMWDNGYGFCVYKKPPYTPYYML
ncbi:unnamed protein product [Bursaphelenchus okinawaensis]|uniref:Uncharacterized protein n=1 Tax=Bursaphelenchus okinawaensis TaxID=465554 RepID=A0A811JWZ1_9BILA|nr:unnamed protein product [Bursaphelenchus okinawaensis]CAG9086603.1 unnamed protein product [Bursaphelenchus okinawaensis]